MHVLSTWLNINLDSADKGQNCDTQLYSSQPPLRCDGIGRFKENNIIFIFHLQIYFGVKVFLVTKVKVKHLGHIFRKFNIET